MRRKSAFALVLALSLLMGGSGIARGDSLSLSPVLSSAQVVDSDLGFMGCATLESSEAQYCFVARRSGPGSPVAFTSGVFDIDAAAGLDAPAVYEETLDSSALTMDGDALVVRADLASVGYLEVTLVQPDFSPAYEWGNEHCVFEPIRAHLVAPSRAIAGNPRATGTLNGIRITSLGESCGAYWVADVRGAWALTSDVRI